MCLSLVFYYPARATASSVLCFDYDGEGGREGGRKEIARRFSDNIMILTQSSPPSLPPSP